MEIEKQISLSPKENLLVEIAKENGALKLRDIRKVYISETYALKIVKRLCALNHLRKIIFLNRWVVF